MDEEQKKKKPKEAKKLDTSREILSTKEASELLGCSVNTVLSYVRDGKLPSSKPGSSSKSSRAPHRFNRQDVLALCPPRMAAYVAKGDAK